MTNEEKVEETTETNDELEDELEDESLEDNEDENEDEDGDEDADDDGPSLEDYEELQKKLATTEAQKNHWRKKAKQVKPIKKEPESKKLNTEQVNQSEIIELSRLAARGYSDEDIELLKDIKDLKGLKSFSEAVDTPLFKANKEERELKEKKAKAQLPASGTILFKKGKEPTNEDLKKAWLGK